MRKKTPRDSRSSRRHWTLPVMLLGLLAAASGLEAGPVVSAALVFEQEGLDLDTGTVWATGPTDLAFKEHHGLQCGFCTPAMIMPGVQKPHCRP